MKVSDYITDYLDKQGIRVVFGYIGGMITHLVDSIAQNENVSFIQTYHEQTAAIAAEGYAKESGRLGVAISTSGPGATNMMTGIADAYFDSIPVLYITGQVNTYEYKYDKPVRQQGFQETDIVDIVKPITKYAKLLDKEEDIRYELEKSIYIAQDGRKGPVLLDIPMNIQRLEIDPDKLRAFCPISPKKSSVDLDESLKLLEKAERPMFLLGGGCHSEKTFNLLSTILIQSKIPVVTSLMGRGAIDETYGYYLGMIGSYGNRCANMGIANADLLIVLGSRLDTRQTGAQINTFFKQGKIIHVDIDGNELNCHRIPDRIKIHCKIDDFLGSLLAGSVAYKDYTVWNKYLKQLKHNYNQNKEIERFVGNKAPYRLFQTLNKYIREGDVVCVDIGQNQMWAAQTLQLKSKQKFVTSGGLAPMGIALPMAIGMSFANRQKDIYAICGDGGFHMSLQSLMLISQYDLPIKVLVINNSALGMITQFQQLYFEGRMSATTFDGGYRVPILKKIAEAYNLDYYQISENDLDNHELLHALFLKRHCIIEYLIKGNTEVSPKLEYNKPIEMPLPLLPEDELKANMLR